MLNHCLISAICCPVCKGDLTLVNDTTLRCHCSELYPIRDSIPILLTDRGRNAYDELYGQIDFSSTPFSYGQGYMAWRKRQINRQIVSHLKEGTVLGDGGGYGYLHRFLDDKKHAYYNCDYSYEILKYDTSELRCVGEGEALPFRNNTFDNVVSGDVLEHVKDKQKYLEEAYRVLKPGGIFVVNTPRAGWKASFQNSMWFWIPKLGHYWAVMRKRFSKGTSKPKFETPAGVVDIPSEESWLKGALEKIGFIIMAQTRTDNHLFNLTGRFWRKFADLFIDPRKYGHCVLFACQKK